MSLLSKCLTAKEDLFIISACRQSTSFYALVKLFSVFMAFLEFGFYTFPAEQITFEVTSSYRVAVSLEHLKYNKYFSIWNFARVLLNTLISALQLNYGMYYNLQLILSLYGRKISVCYVMNFFVRFVLLLWISGKNFCEKIIVVLRILFYITHKYYMIRMRQLEIQKSVQNYILIRYP